MDIWVLLTYIIFSVVILIGWWACWRSSLPFGQKMFWSVVAAAFPIAGTLMFFLYAEEAREAF
ncbi:hypothetical protein GF373_04420 [bacterium]|nr:hypothetical protein [bacterium]